VYSYRFTLHPLSKYPGPKLAVITDWYTAYYALKKRLHLVTYHDHQKYGMMLYQDYPLLKYGQPLHRFCSETWTQQASV
jgi:hypothetical protein